MRNTETVRWEMSLVNGRALKEVVHREIGWKQKRGRGLEREGWPLGSQASFLMLFRPPCDLTILLL